MSNSRHAAQPHNNSCNLPRGTLSPPSDPSNRGGGERNRTDDLLLAKQALSRLSYTPPILAGPIWWAWVDLNYRPHAYQACALTN